MLRKIFALLSCMVLLLTVAAPLGAVAEGVDVWGASVDTSSALWVVTWSSSDESVRLLSVQLSGAAGGNATLSVLSGSHCYAEVDGSNAPYGTSNIELAFGTEMSAETLVISGGTYTATAQLQMYLSMDVTDELFSVKVTDENGNPVAGAPVSIDIGNTIGAMTATTDDYGGASFNIAGMEGGYTWTVNAVGFDTGDGVSYLTATASQKVGESQPAATEPTTRAPQVTDPPVEVSEPEESEYSEPEDDVPEVSETAPQLPTLPADDTSTVLELPSYEAVRGTTTTSASETEIACNLSVDKAVLSAMKLKIGSFNKSGRLVVSKENYEALTKLYGGTLVGSLTASPYKAVTAEQIETAKQSESMFSESTAEKAIAVTFGLALDFLIGDEELHVTDVSDCGEELMFDVKIPVPATMKKCKSFGIAMTGDDTLTSLTQVKAENGTISFRTPALGYYTLVGFVDGKAAAVVGGRSPLQTLFIVLIAAGVLFLLACGFLTYWFFFRKKGQEDALDYADPEDDSYYDGETPDDEQQRADEEEFMRAVLGVQPAGSQDIFSSAEKEQEVRDPIMSAREEVARGGDDIFGLYSRRIDD